MNNKSKSLRGKRIGIFGKGGAGKSTITVLLVAALRKNGYEVCVLDADSTNFGLSLALGGQPPQKTLLDFYGGMVFSGGKVTCPVDDPTPLANAEINLSALPDEYQSNGIQGVHILSAGKIGNQGPGAGCDGPISKISRDLVVSTDEGELVTLVDFKAGFEDSARGALAHLDWAVVVIDPTTASVEIAADMKNMIAQIHDRVLPATMHLENPEMVALANSLFTLAKIQEVFFVLNKISDPEIEDYITDKLAARGIHPSAVVHEDQAVPMAWLKGETISSQTGVEQVQPLVDVLEKAGFDS